MRILVLICCFVFIGGCSIHQPYPESWETKNINKNCFWLNGSFKNVGEYIIDGQVYTSYLSGYFLKDKRLDGSQISLVTFQINDEQNFIVVNALSDSQVNEKAIKFECIEGVIVSELNVDVTGGEAGALVLGVKTERIKLAESIKGNLLLNIESSGGGVFMLVFPVGGSSSTWIKFTRVQP